MKKKIVTSLILVQSVFAFDMSMGGNFSVEGGIDSGLNMIKSGAKSVKDGVSNVLNNKELKNLYDKIPNGSELLHQCEQSDKCNPYKFVNTVKNSHLVKLILSKRPHLSLPQIGNKVNLISDYIMATYFTNKGLSKIVDGLFIKKHYGKISDILVVSGDNKFSLTKEDVLKKLNSLIKIYPHNSEYVTLKTQIESGNYMPLLWNMKVKSDNKMDISVKKADDKESKLSMNYKMNVKYEGHQEIDIKHPKNNFQKEIASSYKEALNKI